MSIHNNRCSNNHPNVLLQTIQSKQSCTQAKEAQMARAYRGFYSMKQLRVLLLPPGWDDCLSQGYPQQYVASTHLYTWVERDNEGQSFLSKETTQWQGLGLQPPASRSEVQCVNQYSTAPHTFHSNCP